MRRRKPPHAFHETVHVPAISVMIRPMINAHLHVALILSMMLGIMTGCGRQPAETSAPTNAASNAGSTAAAPVEVPPFLSPSALKIEWREPVLPARIAPGATFPLVVEIKNVGDAEWPAANSAPAYQSGKYAVRLSHRWCGARGVDCPTFSVRHDLPKSLPPGGSLAVGMVVTAPSEPGSYELQFDAVEELVTWFSSSGAARLVIPVRVQ